MKSLYGVSSGCEVESVMKKMKSKYEWIPPPLEWWVMSLIYRVGNITEMGKSDSSIREVHSVKFSKGKTVRSITLLDSIEFG